MIGRFLLCFCLFFLYYISAQTNIYYPNLFNSYHYSLYQVSPCELNEKNESVAISASNKALLGEFKKIAVYTFSALRKIARDSLHKHYFRGTFLNEREGSFISVPRGYLGYSYSLSVLNNIELGMGAQFGFAGISFSAPTVTQSSGTFPDASLGFSLKYKQNMGLSISSFQLFNITKHIYTSPIKLNRYYVLNGFKNLAINNEWILNLNMLYRLLPNLNDDAILSIGLDFREQMLFGTGYRKHGGVFFFSSFDLSVEKNQMSIFLNYNSTVLNKVARWQNGFEVGMSYFIF